MNGAGGQEDVQAMAGRVSQGARRQLDILTIAASQSHR